MSDEDRNAIDVARDVSKNWGGAEMTPDGMLEEFQLHGYARRAAILDEIDVDYRAADTENLRKFHELTQFRRKAQAVHHTLRKAGR